MTKSSQCSFESVNDCTSIGELVEYFMEKTRLLKICLDIRHLSDEDKKILQSIDANVAELKDILYNLEKDIERCHQNTAKIADFTRRIKVVDFYAEHANSVNVLTDYVLPVTEPEVHPSKKEPTVVLPITSHKGPKLPPVINSLTLSEFNSIPKYMKGRLTYENVNKFIGTFNKTITEKYKFIATPRSQLSNITYKSVQEMKRQETSETKGLYFCVLGDIKTFGQIKPDNVTRSMITILRHCTRIKEIRGPGTIVRYVVIDGTSKS